LVILVTFPEHHSNMVLFYFAEGLASHVKKLYNPSEVQIGNFVFTLHQQCSFVIIIVGLIFSSGNNYLNKEAMICHGGSEGSNYLNNFCFLHGSAHVPKALQAEISSSSKCISEEIEGDNGQDKIRTTHYYIWLPFVLAIIAIMTKLPGILWKNILERGMMRKLVEDMEEDGSKTAHRFLKVVLKGKTLSMPAVIYNFGFAFCELLNLVVILVSQSILNSLFNEEFASYGFNSFVYNSFVPNPRLPDQTSPVDPMCHLFPTEVSCTVKTGGIGGNANKENILCLLPNNVFYQYYFLILWWWWVTLIFITCLGLVYRLVQILLPNCARMRLAALFDSLGVSPWFLGQVDDMELSTWETFLLIRLVRNLKGSQVTKLFEALDIEHPYVTYYDHNEKENVAYYDHNEKENVTYYDHNEEEGETFIDYEERGQNNTEMTIVVNKTD